MGKTSATLRVKNGWLTSNQFTRVITTWAGLEQWWQRRRKGEYAIGFVRYDKSLWFGITNEVKHLPQPFLSRKGADIKLEKIILPNKRLYRKMFARAKKHLQIGDIYQVNLALPITARYTGSATDLFWRWYQKQPTPYAALINTSRWSMVSNSPELGLQLEPRGKNYLATSKPMKGTAPRTHSKQTLFTSLKERAELDMITDVHRNDLAQFAVPGSVKVIQRHHIIGFKTVWQAQANIQALIPKTYSPIEIVRRFFPVGSVTGAPKMRAQEIIAALEPSERGAYCGAIGFIDWRGHSQFNVAIRTATLKNKQLTYHVGSGLTLAAKVNTEYSELLAKAKILLEK